MKYNYVSPDATPTVTPASSVLFQGGFQNTIQRSFYVINDGAQNITYNIQGSPTGLNTGDSDATNTPYSATEIALNWVDVGVTGTINAGTTAVIDFSSKPFTFFRILGTVPSATSTCRIYTQKHYNTQG